MEYVTESGEIIEVDTDIEVGDHVSDKDVDDRRAVVVRVTDIRADEYTIKGNVTVAESNEDYPEDDPVIEVRYANNHTASLTDETFAYPESRLEIENRLHD